MNKRMRELMEKASSNACYDEPSQIHLMNDEIEKFAELIVRECVQTLLDNTPEQFTNEAAEEDWDKGYDRAMKDCVHHIQEHFGVKE